ELQYRDVDRRRSHLPVAHRSFPRRLTAAPPAGRSMGSFRPLICSRSEALVAPSGHDERPALARPFVARAIPGRPDGFSASSERSLLASPGSTRSARTSLLRGRFLEGSET